MLLIKIIGQRKQGNRNYKFALFSCPECNKQVEKIFKDGLKATYCSRQCYSKNRGMRTPYKSKIILKKYRYIYMPTHPNAIGSRKLYVAEHRLVMEKYLQRYLTENEVVHHIDEDTLNNKIENLVVMTNSEHTKYHKQNKKRGEDGRFKI